MDEYLESIREVERGLDRVWAIALNGWIEPRGKSGLPSKEGRNIEG
jgi:hypothetical protein